MADVPAYLRAVLGHLFGGLLTVTSLPALLVILSHLLGPRYAGTVATRLDQWMNPQRRYAAYGLLLFSLFVATYLAWHDEHAKALRAPKSFAERLNQLEAEQKRIEPWRWPHLDSKRKSELTATILKLTPHAVITVCNSTDCLDLENDITDAIRPAASVKWSVTAEESSSAGWTGIALVAKTGDPDTPVFQTALQAATGEQIQLEENALEEAGRFVVILGTRKPKKADAR